MLVGLCVSAVDSLDGRSTVTGGSHLKPWRDYLDANGVVMFAKAGCPYCIGAKELLDSLNIAYQEYLVSEVLSTEELKQMKYDTDFSTVPAIWIGDTFVGGESDLQHLVSTGQLYSILKKHGLVN